jgi:hypothetical protein
MQDGNKNVLEYLQGFGPDGENLTKKSIFRGNVVRGNVVRGTDI